MSTSNLHRASSIPGGADLGAGRAEGEGRRHATPVGDAAGGDHRHRDRIDDLGHQGEGPRLGGERWRISPLVSQPKNLRPPNFPATKNLALTCGACWAGSVQAIKADPTAPWAPE